LRQVIGSTGPVGIITRGTSGIGAVCAVEFGRLGARLVLASLPSPSTERVISTVHEAGGEAVWTEVDVSDPAQCAAMATLAIERYGRIDFLLANAGIADQALASEGDPAVWHRLIETNLLGAIYCTRYVLPHMRRQRSGHVIYMASMSGRDAYVGEPVYIASKWGLIGFGHSVRKEVLSDNIRVTLIEPGLVDTPLTRDNPGIRPLFEAVRPLAPEDIARAVVFAFTQPEHVVIQEISLRPQGQEGVRR
jgi:NADP-dependent 3-hydroxy acid dehydrogenase YdfG